jgi:PTH1 family peptidyl-tRNA hydrolase
VVTSLKLLVGLGNPTAQYDKTRHNAGFWFLDEVALHYRAAFREDARFLGAVARVERSESNLYLLKPATYMNRSGQAVGAIAKYFKIAPSEILVAHDELDLAPGVVRLKRGGGHGGHNGLRDIMAQLDTGDFYRLRLGIGHPGDRSAVVGYVLHPPSKGEEELLRAGMAKVIPLLADLMAGRIDAVMKALHTVPK